MWSYRYWYGRCSGGWDCTSSCSCVMVSLSDLCTNLQLDHDLCHCMSKLFSVQWADDLPGTTGKRNDLPSLGTEARENSLLLFHWPVTRVVLPNDDDIFLQYCLQYNSGWRASFCWQKCQYLLFFYNCTTTKDGMGLLISVKLWSGGFDVWSCTSTIMALTSLRTGSCLHFLSQTSVLLNMHTSKCRVPTL